MNTAKSLAHQGRFGDDTLVHMSTEELRDLSLMLGREPTVNPETGLPEAWTWKKPLNFKKINIKDVVKPVATAAGYYFGGPWGGALANGITTKAQGGSWDDAIRSGAMAGAATWAGGELVGKFGAGAGEAGGAGEFGAEGFTGLGGSGGSGLGIGGDAGAVGSFGQLPGSSVAEAFSAGPAPELGSGLMGQGSAISSGMAGSPYVSPFASGSITGVSGMAPISSSALGEIGAITGMDTNGLALSSGIGGVGNVSNGLLDRLNPKNVNDLAQLAGGLLGGAAGGGGGKPGPSVAYTGNNTFSMPQFQYQAPQFQPYHGGLIFGSM